MPAEGGGIAPRPARKLARYRLTARFNSGRAPRLRRQARSSELPRVHRAVWRLTRVAVRSCVEPGSCVAASRASQCQSDQRPATSALRGQGPETSVRVASAKTGHGPLPQGIATHRNARSVSRDVDRMRAPTRRRKRQAGTLHATVLAGHMLRRTSNTQSVLLHARATSGLASCLGCVRAGVIEE